MNAGLTSIRGTVMEKVDMDEEAEKSPRIPEFRAQLHIYSTIPAFHAQILHDQQPHFGGQSPWLSSHPTAQAKPTPSSSATAPLNPPPLHPPPAPNLLTFSPPPTTQTPQTKTPSPSPLRSPAKNSSIPPSTPKPTSPASETAIKRSKTYAPTSARGASC